MKFLKKHLEFLCMHLSYTVLLFLLAKRLLNHLAMSKILAIDPSLSTQARGEAQYDILNAYRTGSQLVLALIAILLAVLLYYSKNIFIRYTKVKNTVLQVGMCMSIFLLAFQILARLFNQFKIHFGLELLVSFLLLGISVLGGSALSKCISKRAKDNQEY